jgi:hypothetical protein
VYCTCVVYCTRQEPERHRPRSVFPWTQGLLARASDMSRGVHRDASSVVAGCGLRAVSWGWASATAPLECCGAVQATATRMRGNVIGVSTKVEQMILEHCESTTGKMCEGVEGAGRQASTRSFSEFWRVPRALGVPGECCRVRVGMFRAPP